ncbi:hypothetical protein C41B8_00255 [Salinisphaera hydrothermalis C41B8]|uniref:Uncharacterized protein n=1 Tax=Salinisphaera hydrothermalis (strain C41B8) TaxID=1304275 RepID=A0A084IR00_SALHC|nr:hypothetical protein C41B8_00255 [Salinisphaera hydrothermalis C41B8]
MAAGTGLVRRFSEHARGHNDARTPLRCFTRRHVHVDNNPRRRVCRAPAMAADVARIEAGL